MARRQTAKIAKTPGEGVEKLYLSRAKLALPYLVRQAQAGQPIEYGVLAVAIGVPNPRNMNFILGAVGQMLIDLGKREGVDIPQIQCIVVNKLTGLPGDGVDWFLGIPDIEGLPKEERKRRIDFQIARSCRWDRWDWVLEQFGLEPIRHKLDDELKGAGYGGGGEGPEHLAFKEWVARHPEAIGLGRRWGIGDMECRLPSADILDILFRLDGQRAAVEVKARISGPVDILRGLFQCVKYKAIMQAEEKISGRIPDCRVMLVLEGSLPEEQVIVRNLLGIEVVENVRDGFPLE